MLYTSVHHTHYKQTGFNLRELSWAVINISVSQHAHATEIVLFDIPWRLILADLTTQSSAAVCESAVWESDRRLSDSSVFCEIKAEIKATPGTIFT